MLTLIVSCLLLPLAASDAKKEDLERLVRMGEEARPAVLALAAAVKDRKACPNATAALANLGADIAKPALPALTEALRDANEDTRGFAAQALARLGALEPLAKAVE